MSYLASPVSCPDIWTFLSSLVAKDSTPSHIGGFGVALEFGIVSSFPNPFLRGVIGFFNNGCLHKCFTERLSGVFIIVSLLRLSWLWQSSWSHRTSSSFVMRRVPYSLCHSPDLLGLEHKGSGRSSVKMERFTRSAALVNFIPRMMECIKPAG